MYKLRNVFHAVSVMAQRIDISWFRFFFFLGEYFYGPVKSLLQTQFDATGV